MKHDEQDNKLNIANMGYGKAMDYMRIMSNDAELKISELAVHVRKLLSQGLSKQAVAEQLFIELATVNRIIGV